MLNNFHFSYKAFLTICLGYVLMSAESNAQFVSSFNNNGTTKSPSDAAAERAANSQRNYQNRVEQDRQANDSRRNNYNTSTGSGKSAIDRRNEEWQAKQLLADENKRLEDAYKLTQRKKDSTLYAQQRAANYARIKEIKAMQIQKMSSLLKTKHISYDAIWVYDNNTYLVYKAKKQGLIDSAGKIIIPVKYDQVSPFSGELSIVIFNKKFGAVNRSGKEVVPCQFDDLKNVGNDQIRAKLGNNWGAFNEKGDMTIPIKYQFLCLQIGDVIPASLNGKLGGIDKNGTVLVPFED